MIDSKPPGKDMHIHRPPQTATTSGTATAAGPSAESQRRIPLDAIPTPHVRIDPQLVADNIERMASYARQHNLRLRPHAKTHKTLRAARMQLDAGACGLTVAKPSEAEVMSEVCDDLLVAYPIVQPASARRLADLVVAGTKITVAVDSPQAVDVLAHEAAARGVSFDLLIDVNLGNGRTGLGEIEAVLQLAGRIAQADGVAFAGLFFFPGDLMGPPETQQEGFKRHAARLSEFRQRLLEGGFEVRVISGGSTPTGAQSHLNSLLTEIRPGTYIYNDRMCVTGGHATFEQCAARVVTTVVSNAVEGQVVVDAGSKTLTSDGAHHVDGFGHVLEYPAAVVRRLSEEHGMIDVSRCETAPRIGERLTIIPNHICPVINLMDVTYWIDGDEAVAEPVAARGCIW